MDSESTELAEPVEPCWPFWGILKEGKSHTHEKIDFQWTENDYFNRFNLIKLQALRMLQRRDLSEIRFAASEIGKVIDDSVAAYIENETEAYVQKLYRDGGWELRYLRDEELENAGYCSHITEDAIRDLLTNWPSDFDEQPSLPSRDDLSELDALSEFLEYENSKNNPDIEFIQLGLCEAEPHEFYAVLALMTICQAIHSNPRPARVTHYPARDYHYTGQPSATQICVIGDATIQAVEIMAYADKVKFEVQIKKTIAEQWAGLLAAAVNERISGRASKAAQKRHMKNDSARSFIAAEWQRTCTEYEGNKTAFTRDYVRRVFNEFGVTVTEKTMREVWLKDTPTAGKQAG